MNELQNMLDDAPDQVLAIGNSIGQIEDQIEDLQRQIDAVTDELCNFDATALIVYMNDVKIPELKQLYAASTATLVLGPTYNSFGYGTGNITDWVVSDATAGTIYSYQGVNWDDDTSVTQFVVDYAFGNDYLTRPLTSGATYGLIPSRNNLTVALNILQNNQDKVEASIDVFERYV
jgi:hypothetical protein